MEDTKKTVLAGNGEKDVPRAVYDGVLTIDVDAQVESMEEQEEARWHQLLNAHRTRKILTGQLGGIEKLESGWLVAVTYFNGFRIIIPMNEMMINLQGDGRENADTLNRQVRIATSAYIHGDYEKATFLNGYADHYSVTASWQLEDTKLTDVYKELMQNYGRKTDKDIKAVVRITTSDVGVSGANIFYSLQEPTRNVILGNALKVTHKNCKGMEDFTENIESIFDYYREVLKGVMRLCDIWIEHPANAMAGIMKQAGFGKKLLAETVEQFKATTGNEPCSAYEIYCGICESITIARQEKTNERGLLALEEKFAGCVSKRWHEYDIPGTVKY